MARREPIPLGAEVFHPAFGTGTLQAVHLRRTVPMKYPKKYRARVKWDSGVTTWVDRDDLVYPVPADSGDSVKPSAT